MFFLVAAVKGGIGGGDVKLAAACGLVLGLPSALMECQMQKCMCLRNTGKSRVLSEWMQNTLPDYL
ncbi:A24 family peptidase [[Clostridium] symbiosum]